MLNHQSKPMILFVGDRHAMAKPYLWSCNLLRGPGLVSAVLMISIRNEYTILINLNCYDIALQALVLT